MTTITKSNLFKKLDSIPESEHKDFLNYLKDSNINIVDDLPPPPSERGADFERPEENQTSPIWEGVKGAAENIINSKPVKAISAVANTILAPAKYITNKISDFSMENILKPYLNYASKEGLGKNFDDYLKDNPDVANLISPETRHELNNAAIDMLSSFRNPVNPIVKTAQLATLPIKKTIGAVKKIAPFAEQVDKGIQEIAQKRGVNLPVGAQTTSPIVQQGEALLAKGLLGKPIEIRYNNALEKINELGKKVVQKAGESQKPSQLGLTISDSIKKFKQTFDAVTNNLYSKIDIKILKDTKINTQSTENLLNNYIKEAEAAIKGGAPTAESKLIFFKKILNNLKGNPKTISGKLINEKGQPLQKTTEANLPSAYDIRESIKEFNKGYKDALIVTGDKAKLNALRNSLNNDFLESLKEKIPGQYKALKNANEVFKKKLDIIDTSFNNAIKKMADNGKYEDIVELVKNGSIQDIQTLQKAFKVSGNMKHFDNLKSTLLENILNKAGTKANGIPRQLAKYGETAKQLFSEDQLKALDDIDKLNKAMARVGKIKEGSQTAYLYRIYDVIKKLGTPLIWDIIGNSFYLNKTLKKFLLQGLKDTQKGK